MQLQAVPTFDRLEPDVFKTNFYDCGKPVVLKDLAKEWPAYMQWNWQRFKQLVGHQKVALYNNIKSDAYTPINAADDYKLFGDYIDMSSRGPASWRIFLF